MPEIWNDKFNNLQSCKIQCTTA